MAGQKFLPHGTDVSFASSDIGGLMNVSIPDQSKGEVETTDHDSSFDREFLPGLRDNGTVTIQCRHIDADAGQAAIRTNFAANRTLEEVIITLPSEATTDSATITYTFDAFVMDLEGDELPAADETLAGFSATLRVTGGVTRASS